MWWQRWSTVTLLELIVLCIDQAKGEAFWLSQFMSHSPCWSNRCSVCSLIWVTSHSKARSWGQLIWTIYITIHIYSYIYVRYTYHIYILYLVINFPDSSVGKESACNAGDLGLIPGLGSSPGEGKATHSSILVWRIPVVSNSMQSHGLYSPWNYLGQNTGVGSHSLLWEIFPTQE